jgi:hypothetical protein
MTYDQNTFHRGKHLGQTLNPKVDRQAFYPPELRELLYKLWVVSLLHTSPVQSSGSRLRVAVWLNAYQNICWQDSTWQPSCFDPLTTSVIFPDCREKVVSQWWYSLWLTTCRNRTLHEGNTMRKIMGISHRSKLGYNYPQSSANTLEWPSAPGSDCWCFYN